MTSCYTFVCYLHILTQKNFVSVRKTDCMYQDFKGDFWALNFASYSSMHSMIYDNIINCRVRFSSLDLERVLYSRFSGSHFGSIDLLSLVILEFLILNFSRHACMLSHFSYVWLFATLWTVTHQAPLSMGFCRQEYWSGFPCPPPGDLPDPGIKFASSVAPALQVDSSLLSHQGHPNFSLLPTKAFVSYIS